MERTAAERALKKLSPSLGVESEHEHYSSGISIFAPLQNCSGDLDI